MKQKESNYRRYITLCDEKLKQTKHNDSNKFGDEYITVRHLKLMYKHEEYNAYITYNTLTDRYELFLIYDIFEMHKSSLIEGNFDVILDHPPLVIAICQEVMELARNHSYKEA